MQKNLRKRSRRSGNPERGPGSFVAGEEADPERGASLPWTANADCMSNCKRDEDCKHTSDTGTPTMTELKHSEQTQSAKCIESQAVGIMGTRRTNDNLPYMITALSLQIQTNQIQKEK